MNKLQAAYVTGNAHKWLCTPKGSAFLHIREDRRALIRPLSISHGASVDGNINEKIRLEFDWTGTQDPTPWLCIPKSIEFVGSLSDKGWEGIMNHNTNLAISARNTILEILQTPKLCPDSMIVGLSAVLLPNSNVPLTSALKQILFTHFCMKNIIFKFQYLLGHTTIDVIFVQHLSFIIH